VPAWCGGGALHLRWRDQRSCRNWSLAGLLTQALAAEAGAVFADHTGLLLRGLGVTGAAASGLFGVSSYNAVDRRWHRNVFNLVAITVCISLHRGGQRVTFCDNDFAGRISQIGKMQTKACADRCCDRVLHTVLFAAAPLSGRGCFGDGWTGYRCWFGVVDWWGMFVDAAIHCLGGAQIFQRPRGRRARDVTGQVVDTITELSRPLETVSPMRPRRTAPALRARCGKFLRPEARLGG